MSILKNGNNQFESMYKLVSDDEINKRIIILKINDLSKIDLSKTNNQLYFYANFLVEDNTNPIEELYVSKIFPNVVYIRFKNDFKLEKVINNNKKNPVYDSIHFEFFPVFYNKKLLIYSDKSIEEILKKLTSQNQILKLLEKRAKIIILEYNSEESVGNFVKSLDETPGLNFMNEN